MENSEILHLIEAVLLAAVPAATAKHGRIPSDLSVRKEYIRPILKSRLAGLIGNAQADEFAMDFFVDSILCTHEALAPSKGLHAAGAVCVSNQAAGPEQRQLHLSGREPDET